MVQEQPKYFMSELIVFLALEKPKRGNIILITQLSNILQKAKQQHK